MPSPPEPVRVLLVDDDPMSRDLLGILLEGEGYAVQTADSGDAALALLDCASPPPAIVLTDMQMPGTTGRPLAEGLRHACGPATLLLAMSGSGPAAEAVRCFDGFLLKPFTMRQLEAAISTTTPHSLRPFAAAESLPGSQLNEAIYDQLSLSMPHLQLHQLYSLCLDDARKRIDLMRSLFPQGDPLHFVREAHSIKGGAGMLGASEIYRLATSLEFAGFDTPGLDIPSADTAGGTSMLSHKGAKSVNPLDELALACDQLESILLARAMPA